jgi:dihydroorotate dehydrogenase
MYKRLVRPILFLFNPEFIHTLSFLLIKIIFKIPLINFILKRKYKLEDKNLKTSLLGLSFKNKIGLAAGFDKNAELLNEIESFGFGHIEVGTITPKPQLGNNKPRLFRLLRDRAIINRMGFNNDGVDKILSRIKSYKGNLVIGANIGKNKITPNIKAAEDYIYCFKKLSGYVDYFVINISSPNTPELRKLQSKKHLQDLIKKLNIERLKRDDNVPFFIKIAPDLEKKEINEIVDISIDNNIEGIIATNTTIRRRGLKSKNIKSIGNGGLSGKPLKEMSNSIIKHLKIYSKGKIKIIGVGGVFNSDDVIEKLNLGADLVQVYSGWIYEGPSMIKKINSTLLNIKKENLN